MARHPWTQDCQIKGCKRAEYKGGMCREHWYKVPYLDRIACAGASMDAAHRTAERFHRRFRKSVGG